MWTKIDRKVKKKLSIFYITRQYDIIRLYVNVGGSKLKLFLKHGCDSKSEQKDLFIIKSYKLCIYLCAFVILGMAMLSLADYNVKTNYVQAKEVNKLAFNQNVGVPILTYHKIAPWDKLEQVPDNMVVTPGELEEQFSYLKKCGYTTIFYEDLYEFLTQNKPLPKKPIIISFDDGYQSNYMYLPQILKKLDMKAEIAVVTGLPRKEKGEVTNGASYFTWEHAKEMQNSGYIDIVSHTANHANLPKSNDLFLELWGSSNDMLVYMGKRPSILVYPGGKYDDNVIGEAKKYGYKMGVTIDPGVNYYGQDPMKIKRIIVSHWYTGEKILYLINKYSRK